MLLPVRCPRLKVHIALFRDPADVRAVALQGLLVREHHLCQGYPQLCVTVHHRHVPRPILRIVVRPPSLVVRDIMVSASSLPARFARSLLCEGVVHIHIRSFIVLVLVSVTTNPYTTRPTSTSEVAYGTIEVGPRASGAHPTASTRQPNVMDDRDRWLMIGWPVGGFVHRSS